jgi:hypothetical protein
VEGFCALDHFEFVRGHLPETRETHSEFSEWHSPLMAGVTQGLKMCWVGLAGNLGP